jgi:hypothetical protein
MVIAELQVGVPTNRSEGAMASPATERALLISNITAVGDQDIEVQAGVGASSISALAAAIADQSQLAIGRRHETDTGRPACLAQPHIEGRAAPNAQTDRCRESNA